LLPGFEGGLPGTVPCRTGTGVKLAVLEKITPIAKPYYTKKMIPIYAEKPAAVILKRVAPKLKSKKVTAARVAGATALGVFRATKVKAEYDPKYRQELYEKPDIKVKVIVDAIGKPLVAAKTTLAQQTQVRIEEVTREAIKAANKAMEANLTKAEVKAAVQAVVNTAVKTITQTKVKQAVQTKVSRIVKVVTTRITRIRIPPPPIIIKLPSGVSHTLTESELAGSVGWKQGFMYKMIFPPYGINQIVNSRSPIAGIKYHEGALSAYQSIIRIGGKVPKIIERDMGIMDIQITTPRVGKPKIAFQPDVRQRTRLTRKQKRHKPRKREPEPMLIATR